MKDSIKYSELRQLLLDLGFREIADEKEIVFYHKPSDIIFAFRPYRRNDPVASYNVGEVRNMLDARGLMSAEAFENQFKKTPA